MNKSRPSSVEIRGVPEAQWLQVRESLQPANAMPRNSPVPDSIIKQTMNRRAFFAGIADRVTASVRASVSIGAGCENHGVCVTQCETGALHSFEAEGGRLICVAYIPRLCTACGHCETVCPSQAIRLTRDGASQEPRVLTSFQREQCADCGAYFTRTPQHDDNRCPRCCKDRNLAQSAFQQIFGARQ